MYKHLSGKKLAEEILAETLGHYQEFSDDINFFAKMLEMRKKDMGFDWVYNNDFDESMEEEVFFENFDFYMRIMDDMLQYYEDRFIGDDDLEVISEIINWAIDNQEDNKSVEKMLTEVLTLLKERNVVVDLDNGSVVKTMGEVIDTYLISGFEGRHPEQMSAAQFLATNDKNMHKFWSDIELRQVSRFIKTDGYSNKIYWNNNIKSNINLEKPMIKYCGRCMTLGSFCCENELSTEDYLVLKENGFSVKRALEICFLLKSLQKEMITTWNAWLSMKVRKYNDVKRLGWRCIVITKKSGIGEVCYEIDKISSQTSRIFSVNLETGDVKYWANKIGVSITWINARLRQGMSMAEIVATGGPSRPDWQKWCIQRPDAFHPNRKIIRLSDVLKKECVTKIEVEEEIGKYQFGKSDVLSAIKRIKARKRRLI
jgi:hypothetical protein